MLCQVTRDWLRLKTMPGMCQLLRRLRISWKRARHHVHSPDVNYVEKLGTIKMNVISARDSSTVFVFSDEFTLSRHPSLSWTYEQKGKRQPLGELGYRRNYLWRIAAALNAWTGQVIFEQAQYMDVAHLTRFYQRIVQTYPGQPVVMAEDNWPVHAHSDLLASLQEQHFPYDLPRPKNWNTNPRQKIQRLNIPIRILFLPTYASWTNPIEKLWRLLRQEIIHLHPYADDWKGLQRSVSSFLDQFSQGSKMLLRYVGLSNPYKLYQSLFPALEGI